MPTKRYSTEQIVSKLRQAEVDMVLVGTLVRAADQFLVRTQLLEVPSWTVVWSHNAKVAMQSLFQLEDDLTRRLVDSLSLPLTASEDQQLHRDTPQSASAYEFYLRANELGRRPAEWSVARDLYERSVEYDPAYAPAWARLGRLHRMLANVYGHEDRKKGYERAEAAFQRALALNPDLPVAHHLYTDLELEQGCPTEAMVRLIDQAKRGGADPNLFAGLVQACRCWSAGDVTGCSRTCPSPRATDRDECPPQPLDGRPVSASDRRRRGKTLYRAHVGTVVHRTWSSDGGDRGARWCPPAPGLSECESFHQTYVAGASSGGRRGPRSRARGAGVNRSRAARDRSGVSLLRRSMVCACRRPRAGAFTDREDGTEGIFLLSMDDARFAARPAAHDRRVSDTPGARGNPTSGRAGSVHTAGRI